MKYKLIIPVMFILIIFVSGCSLFSEKYSGKIGYEFNPLEERFYATAIVLRTPENNYFLINDDKEVMDKEEKNYDVELKLGDKVKIYGESEERNIDTNTGNITIKTLTVEKFERISE